MIVRGEALPAARGRRVVLAVGKAAPAAATAWTELLAGWATETWVLAPHGVAGAPENAVVLRGSHPIPDADGEEATRRILDLAGSLCADDLLVVLLSGGASSLLAAPVEGIALEDVRHTTDRLLRAGAPIGRLNSVRRALLEAAGGGLAAAASPAAVATLVISDVLGDRVPDIGSGPTVPSPTGADDALAVLLRHRVEIPARVHDLLARRSLLVPDRRPPAGPVHLLAGNRSAVAAAARKLEALGYLTLATDRPLVGEAAARGRQLGALLCAVQPPRPSAVVLGGETTVTVRGDGAGGRSQELALAAAVTMDGFDRARVVLAAGTDGIDGASDNAGALVDPGTVVRIRDAGLDPVEALQRNDSATALAAAGDVIVTGPTGTNVCDLTLLLAGEDGSAVRVFPGGGDR